MVAKVAGGIIGLGLIGTGSIAFAKPEWLGLNKEIPWTPLSADHDFSSKSDTYQNTKFGGKYKDYLVGVVGNKKDKHLNKGMWEKIFKRWEGSKPDSGKFSEASINNKYSETEQTESTKPKALNRVCEDAYKTEITNFGTDDNFKKDDVWKYCSPGTLVTLTNESYDNDTIGSDSTNKTTLISTENQDNDWFWKIRNEDFWKSSGDWSGNGATGNNEDKSIFKKEFERKESTENNKSSRKTIKELCGEAYKLKKGDKANDNTDAQKFCKLETN